MSSKNVQTKMLCSNMSVDKIVEGKLHKNFKLKYFRLINNIHLTFETNTLYFNIFMILDTRSIFLLPPIYNRQVKKLKRKMHNSCINKLVYAILT